MALSGVHITCGYVGAKIADDWVGALFGLVSWSQTMASAGTTSQAAPQIFEHRGTPGFEVYATFDVFIAVGPAPDAVNGPRIFVPAQTTRNIFCNVGDKLAWVPA